MQVLHVKNAKNLVNFPNHREMVLGPKSNTSTGEGAAKSPWRGALREGHYGKGKKAFVYILPFSLLFYFCLLARLLWSGVAVHPE